MSLPHLSTFLRKLSVLLESARSTTHGCAAIPALPVSLIGLSSHGSRRQPCVLSADEGYGVVGADGFRVRLRRLWRRRGTRRRIAAFTGCAFTRRAASRCAAARCAGRPALRSDAAVPE